MSNPGDKDYYWALVSWADEFYLPKIREIEKKLPQIPREFWSHMAPEAYREALQDEEELARLRQVYKETKEACLHKIAEVVDAEVVVAEGEEEVNWFSRFAMQTKLTVNRLLFPEKAETENE